VAILDFTPLEADPTVDRSAEKKGQSRRITVPRFNIIAAGTADQIIPQHIAAPRKPFRVAQAARSVSHAMTAIQISAID
jgi:hypothetical protein